MRRALLLTGAVLLLAAGCGGGGGQATLRLDDYAFKPESVNGDEGKMTLKLENVGTVEHNFTIEAQGIDRDLAPGESSTVTVTMPDSDHVVYFVCKYHRDRGMTGLLGEAGYFPGG